MEASTKDTKSQKKKSSNEFGTSGKFLMLGSAMAGVALSWLQRATLPPFGHFKLGHTEVDLPLRYVGDTELGQPAGRVAWSEICALWHGETKVASHQSHAHTASQYANIREG